MPRFFFFFLTGLQPRQDTDRYPSGHFHLPSSLFSLFSLSLKLDADPISQNYYPESLGVTLLLNAPWIFKGCWSLIKNWIDPYAAKKISFVTQPELLNFINEEDLLVEYGGKDPFTYEYIPISKREELGRTDFKPTWLMNWAQDWKEKPSDSSTSSSSDVNAETITNDLQDQKISEDAENVEQKEENQETNPEVSESVPVEPEES